jgi:hypothetical protein
MGTAENAKAEAKRSARPLWICLELVVCTISTPSGKDGGLPNGPAVVEMVKVIDSARETNEQGETIVHGR